MQSTGLCSLLFALLVTVLARTALRHAIDFFRVLGQRSVASTRGVAVESAVTAIIHHNPRTRHRNRHLSN